MNRIYCLSVFILLIVACSTPAVETKKNSIVTVDPGHFHAALVQKMMYPDVDSTVHVYAPDGPDLKLHLERINGYNQRGENPTRWKEIVYAEADFFEKMLSEKPGNIVMLAGNNRKKTDYILASVQAGLNVFADKPMAVDITSFQKLKEAFAAAAGKKVLLYDIMTERFEITSILQKELSQIPVVFGTLKQGTADSPAITKESVHHFYKEVSGKPLQRPPWFYDVSQEGEGIVDVTTHLVDLVQWEGFPGQIIDPVMDIRMGKCIRWNTALDLEQFNASTTETVFPDYLKNKIDSSGKLQVSSNGEINYQIKGVFAKVRVVWNYKAEPGAGDTHYSIMRGSLADLVIRQGKEQQFIPELYIEPEGKVDKVYSDQLLESFNQLEKKFPGIALEPSDAGWRVVIPKEYREGHEAHFARVTENFLGFLKSGQMPAWEVPNMITKYFITTKALELSKK